MITVWPQYLNNKLTLKEGRKIAKIDAVSDPTLSDIERAVKRLGLTYEIQKDVAYPGKWYEKSGKILVEWEGTKLELIREISKEIKQMKK
ncbi:signal recognition particle subunit SRP19/SEC65 family protein [Methanobrevibacter sp.]|uniref:signal recognition particle subunit SRP19/SEC65 family protein n=1 Tax=Methanobrevibacter sp. TaxID=66852 RepID=UPI0025E12E72|nr:signal recognition particle subunit SRP19/SEC65 family protein [Methanobrevibacter sp.]MBR4447403.1 signal recognition particle protein Srp19 [Methanobrevibacter sp.]